MSTSTSSPTTTPPTTPIFTADFLRTARQTYTWDHRHLDFLKVRYDDRNTSDISSNSNSNSSSDTCNLYNSDPNSSNPTKINSADMFSAYSRGMSSTQNSKPPTINTADKNNKKDKTEPEGSGEGEGGNDNNNNNYNNNNINKPRSRRNPYIPFYGTLREALIRQNMGDRGMSTRLLKTFVEAVFDAVKGRKGEGVASCGGGHAGGGVRKWEHFSISFTVYKLGVRSKFRRFVMDQYGSTPPPVPTTITTTTAASGSSSSSSSSSLIQPIHTFPTFDTVTQPKRKIVLLSVLTVTQAPPSYAVLHPYHQDPQDHPEGNQQKRVKGDGKEDSMDYMPLITGELLALGLGGREGRKGEVTSNGDGDEGVENGKRGQKYILNGDPYVLTIHNSNIRLWGAHFSPAFLHSSKMPLQPPNVPRRRRGQTPVVQDDADPRKDEGIRVWCRRFSLDSGEDLRVLAGLVGRGFLGKMRRVGG
ncbi:hypothetical protein DFH27DRAFT_608648 [Peziza echinospora]|nr:hypothetical protein DFH27DRAFT_608648 [Peziza echinospora]